MYCCISASTWGVVIPFTIKTVSARQAGMSCIRRSGRGTSCKKETGLPVAMYPGVNVNAKMSIRTITGSQRDCRFMDVPSPGTGVNFPREYTNSFLPGRTNEA
jgi:hypothetical protein